MRPMLRQVVLLDAVGPLVLYFGLRSLHFSSVSALIISGVLPAVGIVASAARQRRIDLVGGLVLSGIAVGSALGLLTHDARIVLLDGIVPTAAFGLILLGSLLFEQPLFYHFGLQAHGGLTTPGGRDFAAKWQYPGFRHFMRVANVVCGVAFVVEAGVQAVIIETASVGVAKVSGHVLALATLAGLFAWTGAFATRSLGRAGRSA